MNIQIYAKCICGCHTNPSTLHFKNCCDNGYVKAKLLLVLLEGRDREDIAIQYPSGQVFLLTGEGPIHELEIKRAYDYPQAL